MKRKPLIIIGCIVGALLLIILALPLFINANQFKPTLESQLTSALGRKVAIGDISLSIFSGGVTVSDVSIAEDPAFGQSPFLTAKSLSVGVELLPLIFSKRLEVRSLSIREPEVNLVHASNGTWNYSSLGANGSKPHAAPAIEKSSGGNGVPSPGALSVEKLSIEKGKIIVSSTGSGAKPSVYQDVNLEASDISYTTQFPFKLSATGPGNAALKLDGKAGPMDPTDTSLTPLNATVDVQHLDLATTGFVDPASGIAGIVNFKGDLNSDGKQINAKGAVQAEKIRVSAAGGPSSVPLNVDYATTYTLKSQTGTLNLADIHIGKALARVTGTYQMAGQPAKVDLKLNAQSMPIGDLEGFLPAVGVVLPPGSKLQSGTLTANLSVSGPVDKLAISGPVNLSNAKLAGFSLNSKMGALGPFAKLGGVGGGRDTDIQTLSATMRNDPSGTQIDSLNLVIPSIGTITGNGTVSAAGQLNFKMRAKMGGAVGALTSVTGVGGGGNGLTSAMSTISGGHVGSSSGSEGGIPFLVQGTTSNPQIIPDVGGMAGNAVKSTAMIGTKPAGAAAGALGGLLGKKKKP
jgi:AsmA protein